jgi:hypothetical protein
MGVAGLSVHRTRARTRRTCSLAAVARASRNCVRHSICQLSGVGAGSEMNAPLTPRPSPVSVGHHPRGGAAVNGRPLLRQAPPCGKHDTRATWRPPAAAPNVKSITQRAVPAIRSVYHHRRAPQHELLAATPIRSSMHTVHTSALGVWWRAFCNASCCAWRWCQTAASCQLQCPSQRPLATAGTDCVDGRVACAMVRRVDNQLTRRLHQRGLRRRSIGRIILVGG